MAFISLVLRSGLSASLSALPSQGMQELELQRLRSRLGEVESELTMCKVRV